MSEGGFFYKRYPDHPYHRVLLPDNIPHLIRADFDGENFKLENLNDLIKNEYGHIYESMKDEGYYISDNEGYFYFFEIPGENDEDIIGFASFQVFDEESIILNQIYVLPDYRGHNTFINVCNYFYDLMDDGQIYLANPNRTIINRLINAETYFVLTDRFMISPMYFIYDLAPFNDSLEYTNKSFEEKQDLDKQIRSNLYDLELGAVVNISSNYKVFTGKESPDTKRCSMSLVKDEDEKKYHYLEKRKNDPWIKKGNYFKKVYKITKKESDKFLKSYK